MSQLEATEIAKLIDALEKTWIPKGYTQSFFSQLDLWQYIAIIDDRTCDICFPLDTRFYTGDELRSQFQYLEIIDEGTIRTHTHMPRDDHCRCLLIRITEPTHYIPIMDVEQPS